MSVAAALIRMPHPRATAGVRRAVPSLTLQSTATGWGLVDDGRASSSRPWDRQAAARACSRAAALGVVRLRAGEEPHV